VSTENLFMDRLSKATSKGDGAGGRHVQGDTTD